MQQPTAVIRFDAVPRLEKLSSQFFEQISHGFASFKLSQVWSIYVSTFNGKVELLLETLSYTARSNAEALGERLRSKAT